DRRSAAGGVLPPGRLEAGTGEGETLAAAGPLGYPGNRPEATPQRSVQSEPADAEGLSAEGGTGSALELYLRRSDAALPAAMDRPVALAASGALSKAGPHAARSPRWHPKLLPDESAAGGCGGRQREYQVTAAPRTRLQKPSLPPAEGPAHGRDQNRIRGIQESGLKCSLRRIPAQSRISIWVRHLQAGAFESLLLVRSYNLTDTSRATRRGELVDPRLPVFVVDFGPRYVSLSVAMDAPQVHGRATRALVGTVISGAQKV